MDSTTLSASLLAAAALGLTLGACGDDHDHEDGPRCGGNAASGAGGAGAGGAGAGAAGGGGAEPGEKVILSSVEDKTVRFASFREDCKDRGGFVQTHAACAGVNACRGLSFNKYDFYLTEHTCAAMNSCGGMSCVFLPEDQGRDPKELYDTTCAGCHGPSENGFLLFVPPGTDLAQAEAELTTKPREMIQSAVAFGIFGRSSNGVASANMPAYHKDFSRAEVEAVVEFTLGLPLTVEEYKILGVNEEVTPE
jgi:hypothetical protein